MNFQICQRISGEAMKIAGEEADLHEQHEGLGARRVNQLA